MHSDYRPERPPRTTVPPLPRATGGAMTQAERPIRNDRAILATTSNNKSWPHLVAGASGGMVTALLTSPLDVLRTRLQSDFYSPPTSRPSAPPPSPYHRLRAPLRETFAILSAIQRVEGWRGLFRGLGPNLTGVVPASAIKFYTYGNCKRIASEYLNLSKDAVAVHIIAAATAGIVTSTATNPIWLIKTRLQLDKSSSEGVQRRYKNSLDCFAQTIRQEGIRGLYRGLSASYLGAAETTLHLVLYEQMKIVLSSSPRQRGDGKPTAWERAQDWLGLGGAAGASKIIAGLIAYPHEVMRTRLRQVPVEANGRAKYRGLVHCFRTIWREEGFVALYGGLTPHLLRAVPAAAITLGVYEGVLRVFDTV
ncbi:MAG: hypothetical protein M1832_003872 [Thelocarpon impressellum]|nr:MAG: hypothetical protein M1832_003872 [Thelocarpon impressellum]